MQQQQGGSASAGPPTWLRRLSLLYEHRGAIFTRSTDVSVHRRFLGAGAAGELPAVFVLSRTKGAGEAVSGSSSGATASRDGVLADAGLSHDVERRAVQIKILAEYGGVRRVWWDRIAPQSSLPATRLADASANFVRSVLEGPGGWVPVPRIRDASGWESICGTADESNKKKRKKKTGTGGKDVSRDNPSAEMMSGLCFVGVFQFGDKRGGAELDAMRQVASRGFHRIAYGARGIAEMTVERAPIRGFGWILAGQQPDLLRHLDLFQTPCVVAINVKKGLYTVHQARLPPEPEMMYRFTMSVLAGARRLTKVRRIGGNNSSKRKRKKKGRAKRGGVGLGALFKVETEEDEVADIPTWFEVAGQ